MKLRHAFLYIAVVCIAVMSSNIAWAQTPITGCTTITHSGPYVLKNNITATASELKPTWYTGYRGCIIIAANFVTIDLSGYVITGPGGSNSMGIAQDTVNRIGDVVQSGSVTGFFDGIAFAGTGHTITDVNASKNGSNGTGIGILVDGAGIRLIGNTAAENGEYGIDVASCPNLLLENMAYLNPFDIHEIGGCDVRQENSPAP